MGNHAQSAGAPSTRAQSNIVFGFCAIASLFFTIIAIWLVMVSNHNGNIQQIHISEAQRQLIFSMRDASYQRNLTLLRMATLQDAFARDAEYLQFKAAAVKFIIARRQLLETAINASTLDRWQRLRPDIQQSEKLQDTIVELITDGNTTAALNLIQDKFIPLQREVSRELTALLKSARDVMDDQLITASANTRTQYWVILSMVLAATAIGYAIARTVLKRSQEAETVLLTKNRQIQAFSAITAQPKKNIDEQIDAILQLGCRMLNMKHGLLITHGNAIATVLKCYRAQEPEKHIGPQALIDALAVGFRGRDDAILTLDTLITNEPQLVDILRNNHVSTLVGTSVDTTGEASAAVVFMHDKPISITIEISELIQLISNKLAVLLDQQETLSQLQIAKHTADTANKSKNAFLNHITHKLQSSLNTIIEHNELMQQQMCDNNHGQYLSETAKIEISSRGLLTLISNLFDLTQLESGAMQFVQQPFDIESLLEDTTKNQRPLSGENHPLETERLNSLGVMVGDPAKINRILTTLLSFSASLHGPKTIHFTAWREHGPEDDWLYLEVKHKGSGLSKKQINQLFKFTVSDTPERGNAAFNPQVDLAICKKLCEQLGGDILVDSKPGSGTTFTVCLPCHSQQHCETELTHVNNL